ncbi:MAG TPA: argininosuccinate lyase [Mesorhizobium sp.]|jgi:argininosuccinate lyase|uniref:argininosuccinate lyase n=1 Tax=Mesorhizobium sp. TaxID=1871066 RepID=UPI002DDD68A3|nr:argininosuccinate lyase [Mesorhizobium sp.]HEV2506962.1 argininosuccinate lyase [Mesorhizobium sp.]
MQSKVSPRLAEPLAPEILELVFQPRIERELAFGIDDLCAVNEAHLVMLASTGLIEPAVARELAEALSGIRDDGDLAVPRDPGREDGYFNFEALLMDRAGTDAGGRLHVARSRNDINATLDRLAMRRVVLDLLAKTIALRQALLHRARQFADTIMPGYTHMQPAQPATFGFYLTGIAQALSRDTSRLFNAYHAADSCPLGACAFAGTSFPIDRQQVADLLGFGDIHIHAQDAVASRDYAWDAGTAVLAMAANWGRFAQDMYVWGTQEFGLVRFPDSIAGTSSIMPQKKNPVAVEYLKASSGEVIGGLTATFSILKGGHFSHAGDTGRSSLAPLWPSLRLAGNALTITRLVAEKIEPNVETMRQRAGAGFSTATDLADCLVREGGLSFREAHHVVADLVRDALGRGMSTDEIGHGDVRDAIARVLGQTIDLPNEAVLHALDPDRSIEARRSAGAASPAETRTMIMAALVEMDRDRARLGAHHAHLASARERLVAQLEKLRQVASSN